MRAKTILAISGSLRAASANTIIINTAANLAIPGLLFDIFDIGSLPHFNPDMDGEQSPATVADYRNRLKAASAVLICTPEYAFNMPGVLKNALDWIVASGELIDKIVVAWSASPSFRGGDKAHASLILTLKTMSANVADDLSLQIAMTGKKIIAGVVDDETTNLLRNTLDRLHKTLQNKID